MEICLGVGLSGRAKTCLGSGPLHAGVITAKPPECTPQLAVTVKCPSLNSILVFLRYLKFRIFACNPALHPRLYSPLRLVSQSLSHTCSLLQPYLIIHSSLITS